MSVDATPPAAPATAAPGGPATAARLRAENITVGYGSRTVIDGLDVEVPTGSFTVIIGPNACGKSTLLRALSRLLPPSAGTVQLDGRSIHDYPPKEVARIVGLLPQSSVAPEGITVIDLVARGRYPHQSMLRRWSESDEVAVRAALAQTSTTELATRPVEQLSGGQRQRVWIAMVLAQQTPIVLLDEPTTYLDISNQIELLELFSKLNQEGRTLVAVLHDLNQSARYATHLIAMRDGAILAEGPPHTVVTAELVEEVFRLRATIIPDPETGSPLVVPLARGAIVPQLADASIKAP